jgi:hypothetical protein
MNRPLALAVLSLQYAPADVTEQCRLALRRPDVPAALRVQLLSVLSLGLDLACCGSSRPPSTSASPSSSPPMTTGPSLPSRATPKVTASGCSPS